jgi:hypothetical protein
VQVPPGCNPNGLETIHGPKAKNGGATPIHILDVQFFDDSYLFLMNFDRGQVPFKIIPPYFSMESKNTPIGCRMRPGHQF